MANELRIRQLSIGGLVEDNPLLIGATTLTSASLAAISGGVSSSYHLAIVLDPDGLDGAPEVAYVTALTGGSGSATIARGQEGTTARAHAATTPWVHAATLRDVVTSARKTRVSGDITLNSATFANVDTGLDLTLPAVIGDLIEYGISGVLASSTPDTYFDVATIVSAAVGTYLSNGSNTPPTAGASGWFTPASRVEPLSGVLVSTGMVTGDISSSTVTLRLRYSQASGTNRTLSASTTSPLVVWAKNLGPAYS